MQFLDSTVGAKRLSKHASRWETELGLGNASSSSSSASASARPPPPTSSAAAAAAQRNANTTHGDAIAWSDGNWPPLLRLLHIDVNELVSAVRTHSARQRIFFYCIMPLLLLNLITWTVLAATAAAPGAWLRWFLSLLDVCIGFCLLAGAYYSIFRACADDDWVYYAAYYGFQGTVVALALVMAVVSYPFSFNGWTRLMWIANHEFVTKAAADGGGGGSERVRQLHSVTFWRVMTGIEAALWTAAFAVGLFMIWRVYRYQRLLD